MQGRLISSSLAQTREPLYPSAVIVHCTQCVGTLTERRVEFTNSIHTRNFRQFCLNDGFGKAAVLIKLILHVVTNTLLNSMKE